MKMEECLSTDDREKTKKNLRDWWVKQRSLRLSTLSSDYTAVLHTHVAEKLVGLESEWNAVLRNASVLNVVETLAEIVGGCEWECREARVEHLIIVIRRIVSSIVSVSVVIESISVARVEESELFERIVAGDRVEDLNTLSQLTWAVSLLFTGAHGSWFSVTGNCCCCFSWFMDGF